MPVRKRTISQASTSLASVYSTKRRRRSMPSIDMSKDMDHSTVSSNSTPALDRFIPSRPPNLTPLNITPRTNRISRQFGMSSDRVLDFRDDKENRSAKKGEDTNMFSLLRRSVSSLFQHSVPSRPSSVTENLKLRKQCALTLDGPGISLDPYSFPISWSRHNRIAVACGNDIYYQDLTNKTVSHLGTLAAAMPGRLHGIEWGGEGKESILASGTTTGVVKVWDSSREQTFLRMWQEERLASVGGLSWNGDILAVGSYDGAISLFDVREESQARRIAGHKGSVLNIQWSPDGNYLASGDDLGMVHMWDKRAGKSLLDPGTKGPKLRHRAPVKALAWCPWKTDLLATGSIYPEGKIRIWSTATSAAPEALQTLPLNTSVTSLHWSPHCKELLSTHGSSFKPVPAPARTRTSGHPRAERRVVKPVNSPLMNSIIVHEYPSGKRLLTLTAHLAPVVHSCLSPDGQDLFTVCPKEETVKMWHVWSKRTETTKRESAFDKCTIR
ncbi:WD40-repeat-containing domain protein [Infundibulicybe gibba]|nr:WD40-repeat-containing domain protein [Infundibulicybe gibba]